MKAKILFGSVLVFLLLATTFVNAYYYREPYYPTRNYYMMDYYSARPYYGAGYYNPYAYSYGFRGFYTSYYNDPQWKYYALDSFMRGPRYGW